MMGGQQKSGGGLIPLPLLALAILALLAALWAGLLRLGWAWPVLRPALPAAHGPLMVSGFLGTLISLERAIALHRPGAFLAPLFTGIGGLLLLAGLPAVWGALLITLGSLGLVALFGVMLWQHRTLHTAVMALGALLWLVGNGLWLGGWSIHRVVLWWLGFLVLTIAGERLELSQVLRLPGRVRWLFGLLVALFTAGVLLSLASYPAGMRLAGLGLLLLAAWLVRFDIARRNLRRQGLTRYIAVCLFLGYFWLGLGGLLALAYGGIPAGPIYDAILHAVFLGFVFSMIFGHAPIIFPAVLQRPVPYRPRFYSHLITLQLSLLLRVAGDLLLWPEVRRWGGLLNVLVVLLFLANIALSVWQGSKTAPAG